MIKEVQTRVRVANTGKRTLAKARKAPTAKQLAARRRFTAMVKSGAFKKGRRKASSHRRKRSSNIAAGFYDSFGAFHPIRASFDYDPHRAGDYLTKEGRAKRDAKPKAYSKKADRAKNAGKRRSRSRSGNRGKSTQSLLNQLKTLLTGKPRKENVGNITIVAPSDMRKARRSRRANSGKRRTTRRRTYRASSTHRRRSRRAVTHNSGRRRASRRSYYSRSRSSNTGRSYRRRSRNRGSSRGLVGRSTNLLMVGAKVVAGGIVTKMIFDRLPASMQMGFMKYVSIGLIGTLGSTLVGRVSRTAGSALAQGAAAYGALHVANDFFPGLAQLSPFGLRGSVINQGFFAPQVPMNGSAFNQWITPNPITNTLPAPAANGMGTIGAMAPIRTGVRVR